MSNSERDERALRRNQLRELQDCLDDLNAELQDYLDGGWRWNWRSWRRLERIIDRLIGTRLETRLERALERWFERRLDDVGEAVRQFWQMAMLGPRYIQ